MKIIVHSNFDDPHIDDIVIAENLHTDYAKGIMSFLLAYSNLHRRYYYKLVEDSYTPYKFKPND